MLYLTAVVIFTMQMFIVDSDFLTMGGIRILATVVLRARHRRVLLMIV